MKKHRFIAILGALAMSLMMLTVIMAAPDDTGGPDAFGYVYIDSNEAGGPVFDWAEISTTGISVTLADDASSDAISVTFPFDFYGTEFTEFYITSNGYLSFDPDSGDFSNDCPLSASSPSNIVAIMWDDLDPGDSGALAYYESFEAGNCPYDGYSGACTVAQYEDYVHFPGPDGGDAGTFEAILFDDDTIVMQYKDVGDEGGSGSSTGIGNSDGSINLNYGSCNTVGHLEDDLAIFYATVAPVISVDPESLESTQEPDTTAAVPITVSNSGDFPLIWEVLEQTPTGPPVYDLDAVPSRLTLPSALPSNLGSVNLLGDVIMDGSFETGSPNAHWDEYSLNFGTPLCTVAGCGTGTGTGPNTGSWWAWFGGIGAYEEGYVTQTLAIPSGANEMTFYLEQIVCDSPADYLEVLIDGSQEFLSDGSSDLCGVLGYSLQTVDISAYADGGDHTIEFHSEIFVQSEGGSNFFVDDVSIPFTEAGECGPEGISWASADPTDGTTQPGASSVVDVTFDSTGLAVGVYTGTLCIVSNDAETPELLVDLTLNVEYLPTGVSLSSFSADNPAAMTPIWLLAVTVVAVTGGLVLRRRFSKQTR